MTRPALDWQQVAARAATLDERLGGAFVPTREADWRTAAETALAQWQDAAAPGDPALFARRLARDGWDREAVLPLLGPVRLADGAALPGWTETAQWLLDALLAGEEGEAPCPAALAATVPFADLLWPAVRAARRRRGEDWGEGGAAILSTTALDALDAALLRRMAEISEHTLYDSFAFFREAGGDPLPGAPAGRTLYAGFIAALRQGPLVTLLTARPVMLRLLATIAGQWIAATGEFLHRLGRDAAEFAGRFSELAGAGRVTDLITGISDPHNHGRGVIILLFESGARLVYKPRSVAIESCWHAFAAWCAAQDCPVRLGAVPVWPRGDYGWMRFATAAADLPAASAGRFYYAAGGLLGFLHWLRGSDMHEENILLVDGLPLPVDLETLLQPDIRLVDSGPSALAAERAARHALDSSVLAVDLLPRRKSVAGRMVLAGGLAASPFQARSRPGFTAVNGDAMARAVVAVEAPPPGLGFTIAGAPPRLTDHADHVEEGYRAALGFLAAQRARLFAPGGPLAGFAGATIRHVLRSTAYYEGLRRAAADPRNQGDGIAWSRHFERLARRARWDLADDPGWPLLRAERAALARGDIPLFTGAALTGGCVADGETLAPELLDPPVLPRLAERLDALLADRDRQVALVRQAMLATGATPAVPARARSEQSADVPAVWEASAARAMAFDIAALLEELAIRRGDSAAWMTVDVAPDSDAVQPVIIGDDLYGGAAGIALYLASCYRVGGERRWRDLALAALRGLRHRIGDAAAAMPIGGFAGWGGIIYALTRCATLLDVPELRDEARGAAARIDAGAIAADRLYDVVGGAAGAALGLLSLYRADGDPAILAKAITCGHHIPAHPADWHGIVPRPLAGFSHGAAGIVHALLQLHAASGDAGLLAAAKRGLAFEHGLFDPARRNWPDLRGDRPAYPCQWCHGATGIALARLSGLPVLDTPQIRTEIAAALSATLGHPHGGRDNLCCGHAGRFSVLGYAARCLGDPVLAGRNRARMADWMRRAGPLSGFQLLGAAPALRVGLMQGLPGIGQALLEETNPAEILPVLSLP